MSTIMPQSELVRRAAAFVADYLAAECPAGVKAGEHRPSEARLAAILDEAGMRFNLSPAETIALHDLFHTRG